MLPCSGQQGPGTRPSCFPEQPACPRSAAQGVGPLPWRTGTCPGEEAAQQGPGHRGQCWDPEQGSFSLRRPQQAGRLAGPVCQGRRRPGWKPRSLRASL